MSADPLAALLVREGVLPPPRVEEAQERQVLIGGTLDTALLELGFLDERRLLELLPRAYNARGVQANELKAIDKTVTSLFPRRLAEKHGVVPLDVNGRRLTVAIAGPPDLALLDEIGFMLSVYVKPAVTTQARVAWALAAHYGVPLQPRMEALLGRVGEDPDAVKATVEAWTARSSGAKRKKPQPAQEQQPPPAPGVAPPDDGSGWQVARNAGLPKESEAPSAPKLEAVHGGSIEATTSAAVLGVADLEREKTEKRRKQRVMWTVDDAIAELALAEDRDAMLDVVLRFGYRRLSTVAVFVLTRAQHGHAFVGWDVIDALLDRKDIANFALPAEGSHALAQVHKMESPFLGPLKPDDPLVRLFGRRARAVILVPILVGDRFLGVLYGDAGTRSVPPSSLAELHMVVPRLGKGLGNLILRKKKALRQSVENGSDIPVVVVGELVEDSIAVAARAPSRHLPTIEIDISEIDSPITAPGALSSESTEIDLDNDPAAVIAETEAPRLSAAALDAQRALAAALTPSLEVVDEGEHIEPLVNRKGTSDVGDVAEPAPPAAVDAAAVAVKVMAWADGQDDDEDVKLDDIAVRDLDGPVAPSPQVARIELGLDEQLGAEQDRDADDFDDHGDDDDDLDEVSVDDIKSVPDGAPLLSVPDGPMPGPDPEDDDAGPSPEVQPAPSPEVQPAPSLEPSLEPAREAPSSIAASPGIRARESILAATWLDWLAHEDPELDDLVGQMHRPLEKERKAAVAAVVAHGTRALPSLARYFPGVLTVHPFGSMEHRPEVEELSDCLSCLTKLGAESAAPILVGELVHEDRLHRWTAAYTLSALKVPGALPRLAQRVFDPEPAIAGLALEVLDGYRDDDAFPKVLAQIRDLVRRGDAFERQRAIMAVGELKDRVALLALVDLIGTRPKEIAEEARRALVDITKQDYGSAERRWRAWIADNDEVPRTRWLIDGLSSKDDDIRRSAQVELNRLTGQFFAYRADAPRNERDASVQQWNEWWQQQPKGRWS